MEANGFGSIYPLSYWGVTDSENGFGNVYKDLAGYPTIEIELGEIVFLDGIWQLSTFLTNPAIPTITFGLDITSRITFYSINNEEINTQETQIGIKPNKLHTENDLIVLGFFQIQNYNPNMAYAKGEVLQVRDQNANILPNPFEVDGTNYLVKITPEN